MAALREAMSSLRGHYRRSKKSSANPYSGRGLDKFALVSAELQAKRETLAAQLDTSLSMVKFALGSHNKWIPIILSRSRKKGLKKKSTGLVPEDKSALERRTDKDGLDNEGRTYAIDEDKAHSGSDDNLINEEKSGAINGNRAYLSGIIDEQRSQLGGFINENTTPLDGFSEEKTTLAPLNGLSTQEQIHINNLLNKDIVHLDGLIHKEKTTLGGLLGIQRNDLGEIVEIFSSSSEVEHIAAYEGQPDDLQGHNAKSPMGAAWVVSKAFTVLLRWHTKSMRKNTTPADRSSLPKGEIPDEARTSHSTAVVSSSPSPLGKTPASSPFEPELLPLPSPPARVKTASDGNTADQAAIAETMEDTSTSSKGAFKQRRKCKGRGFLKMRSAPSTPRDSREPQKLFSAASALPKTGGLNDQSAHTDVKEERLIVRKATSPQKALSTSRFSRVSTAEKAQKDRARRVGQALAATGLVLTLSGLMMGYVTAILGVVCWWYLLPSLRKAVGDKPMVRSHHHSHDINNKHSNTKPLNVQFKSNMVIKEAGSDKYDLQSHDYKKKVIMEGFLDRARRSNA